MADLWRDLWICETGTGQQVAQRHDRYMMWWWWSGTSGFDPRPSQILVCVWQCRNGFLQVLCFPVSVSLHQCSIFVFCYSGNHDNRSQRPRGLRRGSVAIRLLGLWFLIPPGTWMFVSCKCCTLSGRGFCVGLITRPEESYRLWFVWVWSRNFVKEEALAHWGGLSSNKNVTLYNFNN